VVRGRTKISFINEIANVCEETGADVVEVPRGMGHDHRIRGHFLKPGIGYVKPPHQRQAGGLARAACAAAGGGDEGEWLRPCRRGVARRLISGPEFVESWFEALDGADACVIVSEWPEFAELGWRAAAGKIAGQLVVEGRNRAEPGRRCDSRAHLRTSVPQLPAPNQGSKQPQPPRLGMRPAKPSDAAWQASRC
jgi:hypothetical protein